jgi:hypothetical protein
VERKGKAFPLKSACVASAQKIRINSWTIAFMPRKMHPVAKPKRIAGIGRSRITYSFTLSPEANWQLYRMCKATGKTRSGVLESLLLPDFVLLFEKFDAGLSFSDVVKSTGYNPDVVRHARREYDAAWKEPEPAHIRALDKKIQIKELEFDRTLVERSADERIARLKAEADRRALEHEIRIERTRAVVGGRK